MKKIVVTSPFSGSRARIQRTTRVRRSVTVPGSTSGCMRVRISRLSRVIWWASAELDNAYEERAFVQTLGLVCWRKGPPTACS